MIVSDPVLTRNFYGMTRRATPPPLAKPEQSTPLKHDGIYPKVPWTSTYEFHEDAYTLAAKEVEGRFQRVPIDDFMKTYFPLRPDPDMPLVIHPDMPRVTDEHRKRFASVPQMATEDAKLYDAFVNISLTLSLSITC